MIEIFLISDLNIDLENYYHFYQTAEGIRKDGHPEWFQLVGLIHDMGKILYKKGCREDGTSLDTMWELLATHLSLDIGYQTLLYTMTIIS